MSNFKTQSSKEIQNSNKKYLKFSPSLFPSPHRGEGGGRGDWNGGI
jgi:hypothetical protein